MHAVEIYNEGQELSSLDDDTLHSVHVHVCTAVVCLEMCPSYGVFLTGVSVGCPTNMYELYL